MIKINMKSLVKKQIIVGFLLVLFGAGMFWAGAKWEERRSTQLNVSTQQRASQGTAQNAAQKSPTERGDLVSGEITAKDDVSYMLKLKDGSNKKIIFSDTTPVRKTVTVKPADLNVGEQVTAVGKNNPDETLSAQNIVVRQAN